MSYAAAVESLLTCGIRYGWILNKLKEIEQLKPSPKTASKMSMDIEQGGERDCAASIRIDNSRNLSCPIIVTSAGSPSRAQNSHTTCFS